MDLRPDGAGLPSLPAALLPGITLRSDPYQFAAVEGLFQMLEVGGPKVLPVIPQLIHPIKTALNTRDKDTSFIVIRALQELVVCYPGVAGALVKHYRHFLPVFNILKGKTSWSNGTCSMPDMVQETLELLEMHGTEGGYHELKRMVPTYESCMF